MALSNPAYLAEYGIISSYAKGPMMKNMKKKKEKREKKEEEKRDQVKKESKMRRAPRITRYF